ncbi:hypothetical protein Aperf_G00000119625 [Anoplocephala perfoliata]
MELLADVDSLISLPDDNTKVYKDECVFSFSAPDDETGLFICLKTFIGIGQQYLDEYVRKTGNLIFLRYNIVKVVKDKIPIEDLGTKPKKLAIGVPGGFELPQDKFTIAEKWKLFRYPDGSIDIPNPKEQSPNSDTSHLMNLHLSSKLKSAINFVQRCESAILIAERAGFAQAWEAENVRPISKYAGGNNHAIEHYERTKYPLAVKLGTITPTSAEVFSYPEDDMVTDPLLSQHLAHFGIDMQRAQKTDQTVAELEIAANERLGEWLTLQEADRTLQPLYGPGLTGLANLGNSCYINAAMQVLFATDHFRNRYALCLPKFVTSAIDSIARNGDASDAVNSFGLQMSKLGQALCSGVYSFPPTSNSELKSGDVVPKQPGIRPRMFRHLIGCTHVEFASKHQQDVQEFIDHLFDLVEQEVKDNNAMLDAPSPLRAAAFLIEDRLECGLTHQVQYKTRTERILRLPIPLEAASNVEEVAAFEQRKLEAEKAGLSFNEDPVYLKIGIDACISNWAAQDVVPDFNSPAAGQRTTALRSSRLATFPDFLCIQMLKFTLDNKWRPCKLNVAIQLDPNSPVDGRPRPDWRLNLSALVTPGGPQPGEVLMPGESSEIQSEPSVDESVVAQLESMGFARNSCLRACLATGCDVEAATNWLVEHMDDPDFADPLPNAGVGVSQSSNVDLGALATLLEMGIDDKLARRALEACSNNVEEAINLAFSNPDELLSQAQLQEQQHQQQQQSHSQAVGAAATTVSKEELSDGDPSRYELIAFISHMGQSTAAGHYVCHVKRSALSKGIPGLVPACEPTPCLGKDEWVIFNDENVCRSESPPFQHAYLYFFRRS